MAGTTEERRIFWPGRAIEAKDRRVRLEVGRRETRRRVSREEWANFVKELLISTRRYSEVEEEPWGIGSIECCGSLCRVYGDVPQYPSPLARPAGDGTATPPDARDGGAEGPGA